MESFFERYRNITVLLLVIFAQLILLAVQVKNDSDMRMIRVWTVSAVTPAARVLEAIRGGGAALVRNYLLLQRADAENRRLQAEVGRLKLDNIFLKNELNTADRAKALQVFQAQSPSKTLAATVFGTGAGANSKVVFVDRGSVSGVRRGMGVITPDGIVGKVLSVYPMASEVVLITDPDFAAGAISQKNQARGVVKGQGTPLCKVDYVSFADKLEAGEWLYTSGDDRIFPRGLPIGVIKSARDGQPYKEVYMEPSGLRGGSLQDVLIVIDNVHQAIPDEPPGTQPVFIAPPPVAANPGEPAVAGGARPPAPASGAGTAADEVRTMYKASGDAQGHTFGAGAPGSKPPDFTKLGQPPAAAPAPVQKQGPAAGTVPKPPPTQAPGAAPAPVQKQAPASGTVPKSPLTQAPAPGAGGQAAPVQKKGPEPGTVPKPPPVQSPNGQTGVPPPR